MFIMRRMTYLCRYVRFESRCVQSSSDLVSTLSGKFQ